MRVEEIDSDTFNMFAKNHIMKNYFQTSNYAKAIENSVFETMFIGIFDENILKGAALILYKNLAPAIKYGYSPRGILIDYYDEDLLKEVTKSIKEFLNKKGFAFLKVNPEITYSILDFNIKEKFLNFKNKNILDLMKQIGYKKLMDNLYFESLLPRFNPIINLREYDMSNIEELLNSKINQHQLKGINFIIGSENDLETFYSLVDTSKIPNFNKYKNYYNTFKKDDMIDLFLLSIDYNEQLKNLQREYHIESTENFKINEEFVNNLSDTSLYNRKMESDKKVNDIQSNITRISNILKGEIQKEIIAGALLIKYEGRVSLLFSGYNKNINNIDINFYLYYKIIEEYQKAGYKFLDLNGITGDFSNSNPFKELNEFKLQFKPVVYEYVGELDLVTNSTLYQIALTTNLLKKEFEREEVK